MGEALPFEPGLGGHSGTVAWPRGSGEILGSATPNRNLASAYEPQQEGNIFAPVFQVQREGKPASDEPPHGKEPFFAQGYEGFGHVQPKHVYGSAMLPA